jgi:flagellar biogenesis protein FliO
MTALLLMQQVASVGSLWGDYVKTMVILVGICALAFGALKFAGPRLRANAGSFPGSIRVLARQTLEPRKNLYVVRAGHTTMLIATSGESVHFMTQLEHSDWPEEQIDEVESPAREPLARRFNQLLRDR